MGRHLAKDDLDPPLRALFIYNHNPIVVHPDQNRMRAGLAREDIFMVDVSVGGDRISAVALAALGTSKQLVTRQLPAAPAVTSAAVSSSTVASPAVSSSMIAVCTGSAGVSTAESIPLWSPAWRDLSRIMARIRR